MHCKKTVICKSLKKLSPYCPLLRDTVWDRVFPKFPGRAERFPLILALSFGSPTGQVLFQQSSSAMETRQFEGFEST